MPRPIESPLLTGDKEQESRAMRTLLAQNGLRVKDIANQAGVRSQVVSAVLSRRENNRRVIRVLESLSE